jgi:hypothetical protein
MGRSPVYDAVDRALHQIASLLGASLLLGLAGCAGQVSHPQIVRPAIEPVTQLTLAWEPPRTKADGTPLTDIAGYKVHYGQRSRRYSFVKTVGPQPRAGIGGLVPGRTYVFAAVAFDGAGNESAPSEEITAVAPAVVSQTPILLQDALMRGQPAQFWVVGAHPGEVVSFLFSRSGEGEGPCSPQLGGLCVDVVDPAVFGEAVADSSGTAILTQTIPSDAPLGQTIAVQAVIQRGTGGAESVKTHVITARVTE